MPAFFKYLFTVLGGGLIGFGLGIIACQNAILGGKYYQVAMILSLITGGFFLALGIPGRANYESEDDETPQAPVRQP